MKIKCVGRVEHRRKGQQIMMIVIVARASFWGSVFPSLRVCEKYL
jgi:hypothetical protein